MGGLALQPLGQARPSSPGGPGLGLTPWQTGTRLRTRGDTGVLQTPLASLGPAQTCISEWEPPGQDVNLAQISCRAASTTHSSAGQRDTWERRRESEGLRPQIRGAPDHRESWREPHVAANSSHLPRGRKAASNLATKRGQEAGKGGNSMNAGLLTTTSYRN